jgi:hypothetical protein
MDNGLCEDNLQELPQIETHGQISKNYCFLAVSELKLDLPQVDRYEHDELATKQETFFVKGQKKGIKVYRLANRWPLLCNIVMNLAGISTCFRYPLSLARSKEVDH